MTTPQEIRRQRLANDFRQMQRIHSDLIQVKEAGSPPDRYVLTVKVKTIIGPLPTYRDRHQIEVVLPPRYPLIKPEARMLTRPQPYHPNWWSDGRWCSGDTWTPVESLGSFVLRMVRTLQFDREITNPASPANSQAANWYRQRLARGLFPCDRSVLPDPDHSRFEIQPKKASRLRIH